MSGWGLAEAVLRSRFSVLSGSAVILGGLGSGEVGLAQQWIEP